MKQLEVKISNICSIFNALTVDQLMEMPEREIEQYRLMTVPAIEIEFGSVDWLREKRNDLCLYWVCNPQIHDLTQIHLKDAIIELMRIHA